MGQIYAYSRCITNIIPKDESDSSWGVACSPNLYKSILTTVTPSTAICRDNLWRLSTYTYNLCYTLFLYNLCRPPHNPIYKQEDK
eukprot:UN00563